MRAHSCARRGKSWYPEVQKIDKNPMHYAFKIQQMLLNNTYDVSAYKEEYREENGKIRHLYKLPYYPDRIIQWAILNVIRYTLENKFISTTYSSIPHRGTLTCKNKVYNDIRHDICGTRYCLKLDIHHFYESINHDLLKSRYLEIFKDYDLLDLIFKIIDSVPEDTGVPIGNFLSQYSGNLFLSPLDHLCKEELKCKYYYRYMDDIVILREDKDLLRNDLSFIKNWCNENKLMVKPNYQIFPIEDRGIDYVGYIIFPEFVLLRKRIKDNLKNKYNMINNSKITDPDTIKGIYDSYNGFLMHCNAYDLSCKYLSPIKEMIENDIK